MSATRFRVSEAASLLGVSDDTVRRWAADGRLTLSAAGDGVKTVDGLDLAELAKESAADPDGREEYSARNRMRGLVTAVKVDGVMAQVDVQAGPFRLVSLISAEAVRELGLEPGCAVIATVKATNVGVEVLPDVR
ncbi:MAG: TOBE domain-containing protein [Solirubrobacterales bacterium]|nr:TOBE domain-containing protein [Solirubrobacterales bacterium]